MKEHEKPGYELEEVKAQVYLRQQDTEWRVKRQELA